MNETHSDPDPLAGASREDILAAIFASMIMQQTNMALMFLGRTPHPDTGKAVRDLDAARMFIDQLEMLEVKTKGNLNAQEERLLKQSLMTVRMAFVEAAEHPEPAPTQPAPSPPGAPTQPSAPTGAEGAAPETDESRKKFVKKY